MADVLQSVLGFAGMKLISFSSSYCAAVQICDQNVLITHRCFGLYLTVLLQQQELLCLSLCPPARRFGVGKGLGRGHSCHRRNIPDCILSCSETVGRFSIIAVTQKLTGDQSAGGR